MQVAVELPEPATDNDLRRHRRTVTLVWLVVAWAVLPRTIQSVTAPKMRGEVGVETEATSGIASVITLFLTLVLLGFCVLVVLESLDRREPASPSRLAAALAPWAYLLVRDVFAGIRPHTGTLVYAGVVVALWRLPLGRRHLVTLGYAAGSAAVLSVVMGALLPRSGVFQSDIGSMVTDDKSVLPWGLLVGFYSHSNTLGQSLALSLPIVLLVPRRALRAVLVAIMLFALLWSASRTSWIAVVISGAGAAGTLVLPRVLRKVAAAGVMGAALLIASLVPLLDKDPTAFSSRGIVWITTRNAISFTPWFGRGSNWFEVIGSTSERLGTAVSSAHSQMLHMLVTGGIVLVALTVPMVVLVFIGALRQLDAGSVWGVGYVLALAGCGVTEVVLRFGSVIPSFPVVVIPLAALIFAPSMPARTEAEDEDLDVDEHDPVAGAARR